jgi:hypothetical protein
VSRAASKLRGDRSGRRQEWEETGGGAQVRVCECEGGGGGECWYRVYDTTYVKRQTEAVKYKREREKREKKSEGRGLTTWSARLLPMFFRTISFQILSV